MKKLLWLSGLILISLVGLSCSPQEEKVERVVPTWRSERVITNPNYIHYVDEYDIIYEDIDDGYFDKRLDYITPSGARIELLAQNDVSASQLLYSYNLLDFYLKNLGSEIADQMGKNKAKIVILNGSDDEREMDNKYASAQQLYANEIANVGSEWYLTDNYEYRDASFEEIFHLVHDQGIGTSTNPQADPDLANRIMLATYNALPKDEKAWGQEGIWGLDSKEWLEELANEGSLEQEYMAAVIDSYYGLWQFYPGSDLGMWGIYIAKDRSGIEELDPMGYELITSMLPSTINTLVAVDDSFGGEFDMNLDTAIPYSAKSQYLTMLMFDSDKEIKVMGNDYNNVFMPGSLLTTIDGKAGEDIIQLRGDSAEYEFSYEGESVVIQDKVSKRDGKMILTNVEIARCLDNDIYLNE